MAETPVYYALRKRDSTCDTMEPEPTDFIQVSRAELEHEHLHLMSRVQQLRRLLGYPPLPTGKQMRRERSR